MSTGINIHTVHEIEIDRTTFKKPTSGRPEFSDLTLTIYHGVGGREITTISLISENPDNLSIDGKFENFENWDVEKGEPID